MGVGAGRGQRAESRGNTGRCVDRVCVVRLRVRAMGGLARGFRGGPRGFQGGPGPGAWEKRGSGGGRQDRKYDRECDRNKERISLTTKGLSAQ